jgi:hypothetical protein
MWSTNVEKDYQMLIECDINEENLDTECSESIIMCVKSVIIRKCTYYN